MAALFFPYLLKPNDKKEGGKFWLAHRVKFIRNALPFCYIEMRRTAFIAEQRSQSIMQQLGPHMLVPKCQMATQLSSRHATGRSGETKVNWRGPQPLNDPGQFFQFFFLFRTTGFFKNGPSISKRRFLWFKWRRKDFCSRVLIRLLRHFWDVRSLRYCDRFFWLRCWNPLYGTAFFGSSVVVDSGPSVAIRSVTEWSGAFRRKERKTRRTTFGFLLSRTRFFSYQLCLCNQGTTDWSSASFLPAQSHAIHQTR